METDSFCSDRNKLTPNIKIKSDVEALNEVIMLS